MDKNRHLEVSSQGGKKRSENYSNQGENQAKVSVGRNPEQLADILATLEVNNEL